MLAILGPYIKAWSSDSRNRGRTWLRPRSQEGFRTGFLVMVQTIFTMEIFIKILATNTCLIDFF